MDCFQIKSGNKKDNSQRITKENKNKGKVNKVDLVINAIVTSRKSKSSAFQEDRFQAQPHDISK